MSPYTRDYGYHRTADEDETPARPAPKRELVLSEDYLETRRTVGWLLLAFLISVLVILAGGLDAPMLNAIPAILREWMVGIGLVVGLGSGFFLFFGICSLVGDNDKYEYR